MFGTCRISCGCLSGPREGRGSYKLGDIEFNLLDTQFLRIGRVLQEVH